MIVLDFLFYHLTYWFENNRDSLSWSTPVKRSTYVIGLATLGLLFSLEEISEFTYLKYTDFHIPKLTFVILGLGIMQLYDYIYITKGRYEKISSLNFKALPNISKKKGIIISFMIIVLSLFTPFIVFMITVPFGGHTLNR